MLNIDYYLDFFKLSHIDFKAYGILITSIMFIWSGFNKILNYDKKIETLLTKINVHINLAHFGMILVILLEIIGFIFLIEYYFKSDCLYNIFNKFNIFIKLTHKQFIQIILLLILIFLIVVTFIYHPPSLKKPIPFLSNLTYFGLFLYIYSDL